MKPRTFILCTAILAAIFLTGCSTKTTIGLLMDNYETERWQRDKDMFIARINELGGTVVTDVANGDASLQYKQAEKMLEDGIDALVIVAVDQNEAAKIVALAHKYKVKVLSYDRLIRNCNLDLYISFDNVEVGALQAEYLTKVCPQGNYVLIGGAVTDNNSFLLKIGQMNVLQPLVERGDIRIVFDQFANRWAEEEGYRLMTECLAKKQKIDAVIAGNDNLATGVLRALQEKGVYENIYIAGQDADLIACQRIVGGTQTMTVYKPIEAIATKSADFAMQMAAGEEFKNLNLSVNNGKRMVPAVLLPAMVVNRETIRLTVVAEGYLKENKIYD
ncbi:MAG: substrate-binding domain-containing protein [Bacteroidales bacterium]|nr:substrate-binding domain-containing protein [Bacteroidales bacterium]MBN2764066.1 substrate-binding domain-containing protein [Bacteroidales bacterium]